MHLDSPLIHDLDRDQNRYGGRPASAVAATRLRHPTSSSTARVLPLPPWFPPFRGWRQEATRNGADVQPGLKLEGRVAIVTGAGSSGPGFGTGKAISVLFAREDARVVLVDKYDERAKETLALIDDEGGEATIVSADLAEMPAYQQVVDEAVARWDSAALGASVAMPPRILVDPYTGAKNNVTTVVVDEMVAFALIQPLQTAKVDLVAP
jgi:hypothetical protein